MGYELWTSPVTGYRRRGTRISELRALFDDGLTVQAILEPLRCCLRDSDAREIRDRLDELDFDVAGVLRSRNSPVVGFIRRVDLNDGPISEYVRPVTPDELIANSTSLPGALEVLKDRNFVFVLIGRDIGGIVTRADLHKPPARVFIFGLISLLEMHLTYWIRRQYPHDSWKERLSAGRLSSAEHHLKRRRAQNEELALLDCIGFGDKRQLVVESEEITDLLGYSGQEELGSRLSNMQDIRNLIAHSQESFTEGQSWPDVVDTLTQAEDMIARSDDLIEDEAVKSSNEDETTALEAFFTA